MAKKESYRNVRRANYTQVTNSLLNDKEATLQAKGLLSIFLSNSDDWEIHMDEIITRSKNGRDAHYKVVNELIELGYFARIQVMNSSSNRFEEMIYLFSDIKQDVADELENIKNWAKENEKNLMIEYKTKKEKKKKKTPFPENQGTDKNPITDFQETENELTETQYNNNTKLNNINLKNKKEEEEKVSSIQLEKSVKEYLTSELKYNSTLLLEIAEQMASFSIDSFTKAEMESQHNYMVGKNKIERITEWAFYFVNGIVLQRKNPKNKVATTGNKKKRTGSAKKAIRTEMVPDWLHTDTEEQEANKQKKVAITDEYKKKVWEQVKALDKGNSPIRNIN